MDHVQLCRALWQQKAVVDAIKEQLDAESTKFEDLKKSTLKELDARELTKQHIPGFGTVSVQTKWSVQTPKTAEDKLLLFAYIEREKGKDALLGLQSIHSGTLNSFYDAEAALASERGDHKWTLPGVGEPKDYKLLALRKG